MSANGPHRNENDDLQQACDCCIGFSIGGCAGVVAGGIIGGALAPTIEPVIAGACVGLFFGGAAAGESLRAAGVEHRANRYAPVVPEMEDRRKKLR